MTKILQLYDIYVTLLKNIITYHIINLTSKGAKFKLHNMHIKHLE